MEVIIAGYNKTIDNLNPEIISASYARVSRQPRTIPEIREEAKKYVEKCRESNKNIVFGIGHASIAEHVVFNIDIIGVSRFLVEEIESHRLASYTEKSQRYVLFDGDYTIPLELEKDKDIMEYVRIIEKQNDFYKKSYPIILEYFKLKNPEKYKEQPKTVEGWAKEDARYIISLATQTQLGMTINARNLELMIRRLRACPFLEHKELANRLYEKVYEITPSLFPYTQPSEYEIKTKEKQMYKNAITIPTSDITINRNDYIMDFKIAGLLEPKLLTSKETILNALKGMNLHDSAPREFENVDFTFTARVSASCFAQLKRHRMMTLIPMKYTNYERFIIPESIINSGLEKEFNEIIKDTNSFFNRNEKLFPYVVANSHSRIVFFKINLREMYHFCRMRMDGHAQWEIRKLAENMCRLAKEQCPAGMSLCCGKDKFDEVYKEVFG